MNLILLDDADFIAGDRAFLRDSRFQHIQTVHRAQPGDTVKIGHIGGLRGSADILSITQDGIELAVKLYERPPEKLPLTVLLALPRPKMLRRILRNIAEFGIPEMIFINSYRVEKSYWATPLLHPDIIKKHCIEGLQQSGDTVLPRIQTAKRFKPFVEDELPQLMLDKKALVAHPGGGESCPLGTNQPSIVAIGPEGGFIPYEIDKFCAAGFSVIDLGPRILKVENALSFIVARMFC